MTIFQRRFNYTIIDKQPLNLGMGNYSHPICYVDVIIYTCRNLDTGVAILLKVAYVALG